MKCRSRGLSWGLLALLVSMPVGAGAQMKPDPDGMTPEQIRQALPEYFAPSGGFSTDALPDIYGPGHVLSVGNVYMKVTNIGHNGVFYTNLSSDPAGQWPGASGVEYLSTFRLNVGAKNPAALDPTQLRRVSYNLEWRPPTLDAVDHIYDSYDGIVNGARFNNDDGDFDQDANPRVDEDFLNGKDDDGDGRIDEDYGAIGQQMFALEMRDDTPQAINATFNEKHVPLGILVQELAFAFSVPGFTDFDGVEYNVKNISGHRLDSVYVGFLVDMDVGPLEKSNFFTDDFDISNVPQDSFYVDVDPLDPKYQLPHAPIFGIPEDTPLCPVDVRVLHGYSIGDDDGDEFMTPGCPSFLLLGHTIDPLGIKAPPFKGWHSFRSFTAGTPYQSGGNPIVDQQRYEFLAAGENVDRNTGFITVPTNGLKGDQVQWCSVGPFLSFEPNEVIQVTVGFAVQTGRWQDLATYGRLSAAKRRADPIAVVANALSAQTAYDGVWEDRAVGNRPNTNFHGRETMVQAPPGQIAYFSDCRGGQRLVRPGQIDWFDFDCNYCTGVWTPLFGGRGYFHRTWNASAPPPNPRLNVQANYNYTSNPERRFSPIGDQSITLAWDNLSEYTADPKTNYLDFYSYKIWKAANWTRPVGSSGPGEDDWSLLGEFVRFRNAASHCAELFIPSWKGVCNGAPCVKDTTMTICVSRGDLINYQTGEVVHADNSLDCVRDPATGDCLYGVGKPVGCVENCPIDTVYAYPVGRYRFVDTQVQNGFIYFYSVTGRDSSDIQLEGRRSSVEAEGVVPQIGTRSGKHVWVVPNPYRGRAQWDLIPNATDPTGTHIDFLGMPAGRWTLKIYTISGDLVQTLHSTDPVNESVRPPVSVPGSTETRPGYNTQQDVAGDGQARWNLITRNGQDVVSGIYLFTVDSKEGTQRGKFVIVR